MNIAIFGGTFDPVHNGHLAVAREAAELCGLDRVLFVPAGRPPHKSTGPRASYADRYRMVEIACAGEPRFEPSRLEEGDRHSYSIDTIERLRQRLNPGDRLFFLIGADAFAEIETWRRWDEVLRSVEFIVVSRPGHQYRVPTGVKVERLERLALPVSSSEIRSKLAAGDRDVDVPSAVLDYIREKNLYRE